MSAQPLAFSISDLDPDDEEAIRQAARLLVEGFRDDWPDARPEMDAALEEVRECLGEGRVCRVAVDEGGAVLGWIGAMPSYGENVWELHPLVVRPDAQRRGIGRALVADLEERVGERGGYTLWLGTDDETNMTTLSGVDLYPDVLEHLGNMKNLRGHPYEFYQRLGFSPVGVMPDANGPGKPDIYMAKRLLGQKASGIRGRSANSVRLHEPSRRKEPHGASPGATEIRSLQQKSPGPEAPGSR